jgi:hypothetical protein
MSRTAALLALLDIDAFGWLAAAWFAEVRS